MSSKGTHFDASAPSFCIIQEPIMHFRYVRYVVIAASLVAFGCSKDASVVDPSSPTQSALISSLALSEHRFDTDTISTISGKEKTPDDLVEISFSITVKTIDTTGALNLLCDVYQDNGTTAIYSIPLTELTKSVYTASLKVKIKRGDVGDYRLEVHGTDRAGVPTNNAISKFSVIYGTKPPVMVAVFAPDSVALDTTATVFVLIQAQVRDSSGLADIKRVTVTAFKPTNERVDTYEMYDDGTHGDPTPNDGIYSVTLILTPEGKKGRYRFEFQALDYGNLASNVLIHYIYII